MCGIIGAIDPSLQEGSMSKAVASLSHRGPDNRSTITIDHGSHRSILGHTRLSIIDTSELANQPFLSGSGKFTIIYNGEIYNYRELKRELADSYAAEFRTSSDTELIVEGFEREGVDFVRKLTGMFAFSIVEHSSGIHYLFRDRLGIKPLFYRITGNGLIYASEIKAIAALSEVHPDRQSCWSFLHLGYIPGPETVYLDVKKFPAGHYGIYDGGRLETTPFWVATDHMKLPCFAGNEPLQVLNAHLQRSVRQRLLADVPVGIFLSGGIDSSLIAALASREFGSGLPTFNIGVEDSRYNESSYARQVALHLGTEHHEWIITEKEAMERVDQLLHIFDEPFGDSSAIPTLLLSELASRHVKVCLSGDGGDELFMGYGMYNWARRLGSPVFNEAVSYVTGKALSMAPTQRGKRASWLFEDDSGNRRSHIFSQEQYLFSQKELKHLLYVEGRVPVWQEIPGRSAAENQSFYDLTNYLVDDLLVKVDRASMHHSLEVRVPLLDHSLVEFALSLPENFKMKGSERKILLREALFSYLPSTLFSRPKKGFSIPLASWLRADLKYLVDTYLSEETLVSVGMVSPGEVRALLDRFYRKGEDRWYNRIWALVVLHKFISERR